MVRMMSSLTTSFDVSVLVNNYSDNAVVFFFDKLQNTGSGGTIGISVYAPMDPNLPTLPPNPDFMANDSSTTIGWPWDPGIPGAGTLTYTDIDKKLKVTLTDFAVYQQDVYDLNYLHYQYDLIDANEYHPINDGPDLWPDMVGQFTLQVEPITCQDRGLYRDTDLSNDCRVNLDDFVLLINDWLKCNDPLDPSCTDGP